MIACTNTTRLSISVLCVLLILSGMTGCTSLRRPPVAPIPEKPVPTLPPPPIPKPVEPVEPVDPRHKASLQLTDQGRMLLQQNRYDDAIRTLEQAITLYPQNGESYYYMAEAWLAKNNFKLAGEFNRLAAMYLNSPQWASRINRQQRAIAAGPSGS